MRIRITAVEADELLTAIQRKLEDVALGSVLLIDDKMSARMLYDAGSIIRETVLEFEERRIEAGRKSKPATRKRAAKKTTEAPPA